MQRWIMAWLLVLCAAWMPARAADEVSAADAAAARSLVTAQLAAFRADDAERAFSYAAPSVRAQFGDAEKFMAMVRAGYRAVYRPAGVDFMPTQAAGIDLIQQVRLSDADGTAWLAIYRLQRQPGGAWQILSCQLAQLDGRAV
jgi:hypothetical protein